MAPKRDSGRFPRGYRSHTKGSLLARRSGGSHWGSRSDVAVASRFYILHGRSTESRWGTSPSRSVHQSPLGRVAAASRRVLRAKCRTPPIRALSMPGYRGLELLRAAWSLSLPVYSFSTRATLFILTNRQRNPRSVFPCSVTFPDAGTLGPGRPGFGETVGNTTSHGLAAPRRVLEHVGRTSSSSSPGMYPSLSGLLRECFLDERRFPTFEVLAGKHRVVP